MSPHPGLGLLLLRRQQVGDGAFSHFGGEADGFREGGVGVDGEADVFRCGAHFDGEDGFGELLADMDADDAGADDAAGFLVHDQFGHALGAAQHRHQVSDHGCQAHCLRSVSGHCLAVCITAKTSTAVSVRR